MKKKRILALFLAAVSCLSLAVSASAANTVNRKATDFRDFDRTAWYAEAVSAAVDNGLLYGKSSTTLDPNGDMTRAEMAAIINRSFGCYKTADISQYKDVSKDKWYYGNGRAVFYPRCADDHLTPRLWHGRKPEYVGHF